MVSTATRKIVFKRELHSKTNSDYLKELETIIPVGDVNYSLTDIFDSMAEKSKTEIVKSMGMSLDVFNDKLKAYTELREKFNEDKSHNNATVAMSYLKNRMDFHRVALRMNLGKEKLAKDLLGVYRADYLLNYIDEIHLRRVISNYSVSNSLEEVCEKTKEKTETILKLSNPNVRVRFMERDRTSQLHSMVYCLYTAGVDSAFISKHLGITPSTVSRYIKTAMYKRKHIIPKNDFFNRVTELLDKGYNAHMLAKHFNLPLFMAEKIINYIEEREFDCSL